MGDHEKVDAANVEETREKGVQTIACPTCGNELKATELPDGGVSHEECSTCNPVEEPEKASKSTVSREKGTTTTSETEEK